MINKKTRRHSGRITPNINFLGMTKKEIIENCLEPQEYWNDWKDYRDGFRMNKDRKLLRNNFMNFASSLEVSRWNSKLKKLILRRRARA